MSDLLFLATSDSGTKATQLTPLDLDDVIRFEAKRLQPRTSVRIH